MCSLLIPYLPSAHVSIIPASRPCNLASGHSFHCSWLVLSSRHTYKATRIRKKEGNMTLLKASSKPAISDSIEIQIHQLCDKTFKTVVLKVLRELQENTDEQFYEIREIIQGQLSTYSIAVEQKLITAEKGLLKRCSELRCLETVRNHEQGEELSVSAMQRIPP